ncbi:Fanconi anemia group M protein isoform X2 [Lethenteron reissneri]|uniref:Fanconi anemia group M protein isoform X2 n=1 Tax=Lethenteron reissneri TaxID=7753 RepID=UPI002AB5FCE3|nr:Fanconi anemia group M protein isoform X2 [Lethenteron reissneri]
MREEEEEASRGNPGSSATSRERTWQPAFGGPHASEKPERSGGEGSSPAPRVAFTAFIVTTTTTADDDAQAASAIAIMSGRNSKQKTLFQSWGGKLGSDIAVGPTSSQGRSSQGRPSSSQGRPSSTKPWTSKRGAGVRRGATGSGTHAGDWAGASSGRGPSLWTGPETKTGHTSLGQQVELGGYVDDDDDDDDVLMVAAAEVEAASGRDVVGHQEVEHLPGFDVTSGDIWIYPTNFPVREYQYSIVQTALFNNTMVCLPTGLGKTFIAAVVMYNFYRWYPSGKILFMAPTKPLVAQQMEACHNVMGISQEHMAEMTGSTMASNRQAIWAKKRLFFLTPHVMKNDLCSEACPAAAVKCLVVDEAHKAMGNYSYCQVVNQLVGYSRQFRVLALSATPGSDRQSVQQVLNNLLISRVELRSEDSPDILPYSHERVVEKIVVEPDEELSAIRVQYLKVLEVFMGRLSRIGAMPRGDMASISKYQVLLARDHFRKNPPAHFPGSRMGAVEGDFALCVSLYHGFELLLHMGSRSLLLFLKSILDGGKEKTRARNELSRNPDFMQLYQRLDEVFRQAGSTPLNTSSILQPTQASVFAERVVEPRPFVYSHPKLRKLEEVVLQHFQQWQQQQQQQQQKTAAASDGGTEGSTAVTDTRVMIFSSFRDSVQEIAEMLSRHHPLVRAMMFVGQSSSSGKATRGFTQKEQVQVVKRFRHGGYNTLVATCVGEEGLDIGEVDLIVCFDAQKSPVRLVQRMGRTGRRRHGRIVVILAHGREERMYNQSQSSRKSIYKAIEGASTSFQLYPYNPRMVPAGLSPVPHRMHLHVPKFDGQTRGKGRLCQTVAEASTTLGSLGRKQPCRSEGLLTRDEEDDWERRVRPHHGEKTPVLALAPFACLPDPERTAAAERRAGDDHVRELSLCNYVPWQTKVQDTYALEHSEAACLPFIRLMTLVDKLKYCEDEEYGFEAVSHLDRQDVLSDGAEEDGGTAPSTHRAERTNARHRDPWSTLAENQKRRKKPASTSVPVKGTATSASAITATISLHKSVDKAVTRKSARPLPPLFTGETDPDFSSKKKPAWWKGRSAEPVAKPIDSDDDPDVFIVEDTAEGDNVRENRSSLENSRPDEEEQSPGGSGLHRERMGTEGDVGSATHPCGTPWLAMNLGLNSGAIECGCKSDVDDSALSDLFYWYSRDPKENVFPNSQRIDVEASMEVDGECTPDNVVAMARMVKEFLSHPVPPSDFSFLDDIQQIPFPGMLFQMHWQQIRNQSSDRVPSFTAPCLSGPTSMCTNEKEKARPPGISSTIDQLEPPSCDNHDHRRTVNNNNDRADKLCLHNDERRRTFSPGQQNRSVAQTHHRRATEFSSKTSTTPSAFLDSNSDMSVALFDEEDDLLLQVDLSMLEREEQGRQQQQCLTPPRPEPEVVSSDAPSARVPRELTPSRHAKNVASIITATPSLSPRAPLTHASAPLTGEVSALGDSMADYSAELFSVNFDLEFDLNQLDDDDDAEEVLSGGHQNSPIAQPRPQETNEAVAPITFNLSFKDLDFDEDFALPPAPVKHDTSPVIIDDFTLPADDEFDDLEEPIVTHVAGNVVLPRTPVGPSSISLVNLTVPTESSTPLLATSHDLRRPAQDPGNRAVAVCLDDSEGELMNHHLRRRPNVQLLLDTPDAPVPARTPPREAAAIAGDGSDLDSPMIRPKRRVNKPLLFLEESSQQNSPKVTTFGAAPRDRRGDDDDNDDDFQIQGKVLRITRGKLKAQKSSSLSSRKPKKGSGRQFLDEEAELSEEGAGSVSSDERSDAEGSESSMREFINDASTFTQGMALNESAMHGVYLKSVQSPTVQAARYKLSSKPFHDIFSQVPEEDESYLEDSFCVSNDVDEEEEAPCLSDNDNTQDLGLTIAGPGARPNEEEEEEEEGESSFVDGKRRLYRTRRQKQLDLLAPRRKCGDRSNDAVAPKRRRILAQENSSSDDDDNDDKTDHVTERLLGAVQGPNEWNDNTRDTRQGEDSETCLKRPPAQVGTSCRRREGAASRAELSLAERCRIRLQARAEVSDAIDFQTAPHNSRDSTNTRNCSTFDVSFQRPSCHARLGTLTESLEMTDVTNVQTSVRRDPQDRGMLKFDSRLSSVTNDAQHRQAGSSVKTGAPGKTAPKPAMTASSVATPVDQQDELLILVGSHEVASTGQEVVTFLRQRLGVHAAVLQGVGGDYVVSRRMAVKRAATGELAGPAGRSRVAARVRALQERFERVCVIVERERLKPGEIGAVASSASRPQVRTRCLDAALAGLAAADVRVLFSSGPVATATLLQRLALTEQHKGVGVVGPAEPHPHERAAFAFYCRLPGVSYVTALGLCRGFRSVQHALASSASELRARAGMSDARAERLHQFLRYPFDPIMLPVPPPP